MVVATQMTQRNATPKHKAQPAADRLETIEELRQTTRTLERQVSELKARNAELLQASEVKVRFLANMSHELRAPLNAINGFAELLADESYGALTDEQRGFVGRVRDAGQHLLQLITDVIDLARVEAGRMGLDRQPRAVDQIIDQTVAVIRGTARGKNVTIRLAPGDAAPVVLVDERRVKQVLYNLLSNAVRYAPEGSSVDVSAAEAEGWVTVRVTDRGPGIASADQERIFEEFVRAGRDQQEPTGSGLGLAISRTLVRLHGGELGVHSVEGEGSTFWFTLPVASPEPGATAAPAAANSVHPEPCMRRS